MSEDICGGEIDPTTRQCLWCGYVSSLPVPHGMLHYGRRASRGDYVNPWLVPLRISGVDWAGRVLSETAPHPPPAYTFWLGAEGEEIKKWRVASALVMGTEVRN